MAPPPPPPPPSTPPDPGGGSSPPSPDADTITANTNNANALPTLEHILYPPPTSIEEAGALLGASITRLEPTLLPQNLTAVPPPPGMHSSFSTVRPVANSELYVRLASLRGLLRERAGLDVTLGEERAGGPADNKVEPLQSAPSLLAVLMKLMGMTAGIASASPVVVTGGPNSDNSTLPVNVSSPLGQAAGRGGGGGAASSRGLPAALAAAAAAGANAVGVTTKGVPVRLTPPLLSNAMRTLWVDCVVLCYRLGEGLTGPARVDSLAFLRRMMEVVALNPRSQRAAGGTRMSALQVIAGLFSDEILARKVAPWAYDVLHLCHKALKSSGNHEPYYRLLAVRTATSVAVGCRTAAIIAEEAAAIRDGGPSGKIGTFLIQGAWEDKATVEVVKLLNRAVDDRYPEVRGEAATFAAAAAPLIVKSDRASSSGGGGGGGGGSSSSGGGPMSPAAGGGGGSDQANGPLSSLDDVMHIALKNLDDESAGVACGWAEAMARCICTSIEAEEKAKAEADLTGNRHTADDGDGAGPSGSGHGSASSGASAGDFAAKFKAFSEGKGGGRTMSYAASCTSVIASVNFLVARFIKVGGEYTASKCGGAFSSGGRAVRVGIASVLMELLKLQVATDGVGMSGSAGVDVLMAVLEMVGPAMEQQLQQPSSSSGHARTGSSGNQRFSDTLEVTSSPVARASDRPSGATGGASSIFSQNRKMRSAADSGIVRTQASLVLRRGLAEVSSEGSQQAILRDLAALCRPSLGLYDNGGSSGTSAAALNRYQLQIVLIEMSHLITALGEAATSAIEDILPFLKVSLSHHDHGVRYEAAIALQATARAFPREGRKAITTSLDSLMESWDNLVSLAGSQEPVDDGNKEGSPTRRRRLIRRNKTSSPNKSQPSAQMEKSLRHQYSVHGHALAISLLLHELPMSSGGIATEMLDKAITVAYSLVKCQDNELLAKVTPGAVCTCVRSGYGLICAALSTGPQAVTSHIAGFFRLWQNSGKHAEEGTRHFSKSHDLTCLDAMLVSLVSFLKSCSELLLSVPDALNRTTVLLEKVFPLVAPGGRLGNESDIPSAASRLDSAKASVMEAFSWLPPGSYAFAADQVFSFAALHIQKLTEEEVCCSIVGSLVTSEDKILDAHSFLRATSVGQTGGATTLEENLVALSSDPAHHSERESVLHTLAWKKKNRRESFAMNIFESRILELSDTEEDRTDAPTPLHAVGTWKQPSSSSAASQVRLLDAAIHTFAATFGMQDGRAQERASRALGSLLPATLLQSARSLSVTASSLITENEKQKSRSRDEIAAASNISATLLACLQALPLHEASTENFISMGPPWMNRSKDLFFALLPSSVHLVRRAAAEGLSLLATLGVTEDAHTLQSSILHSLDELMKGHLPDGTPRKFQLSNDALSSVRAGSLLTLACIQRTAQKMDSDERDRARARSSNAQSNNESTDTAPQTMIMLTRVLPSCATHNLESDFFYVRAHALHALEVLISYSMPDDEENFSQENLHTIQKAVEAVEANFLLAWTAITADFDGGREGEKFAAEPAFLSVLLRFMTFLLPRLHLLDSSDSCIASRFSSMASLIMENSAVHPTVIFEGLVFFEKLSAYKMLLSNDRLSVGYTGDPATSCIPFISKAFGTVYPEAFLEHKRMKTYGLTSVMCQRAAVNLLRILSQSKDALPSGLIEDAQVYGHLLMLLDMKCGSKYFQHSPFYRTISASRDAERSVGEGDALETEIVMALRSVYDVVDTAAQSAGASRDLLHIVLVSRVLLAGNTRSDSDASVEEQSSPAGIIRRAEMLANAEASLVLSHSSTCRWQLKCLAAKTASDAIHSIARSCRRSSEEKECKQCPDFNPSAALTLLSKLSKQCSGAAGGREDDKHTSYVALHLQNLITAACSTAVATSDQAELPSLQWASLKLLTALVEQFGDALDPESSSGVDGHNVKALQQYSSQIASGVRHALNSSEGDVACEGLPQLYVAGCEALQMVAKTSIISDATVLKRFVRNVMLSASELSFVAFSEATNKDSPLRKERAHVTLTDDRSIPLLLRVWKLRTLAELRLNATLDLIPQPLSTSIEEETCSAGGEIGVHAAALALDGARVLRNSTNCLCASASSADTIEFASSQPPGLTFSAIEDVDESVISSMSLSWPFLANYAVSILSAEKNAAADEWLEALAPLLCAGLLDALDNISCVQISSGSLPSPEDAAIACLDALCTLLGKANKTLMSLEGDLQIIIESVKDKVILPTLKLSANWRSSKDEIEETKDEHAASPAATGKLPTLAAQACGIVEATCRARVAASAPSNIGGKALLQTILTPLAALESGAISLAGDDYGTCDIIISSCIQCSRVLLSSTDIGGGIDQNNLTKAMLKVALSVLTTSDGIDPATTKTNEAAIGLLTDCVRSTFIDDAEKRQLAVKTADGGCWDAWKIICSELENGVGLSYSMPSITKTLGDFSNTTRQSSALTALRSVVQESDAHDGSTVGIIIQAAGAEIMNILLAYGICSAPQGGSFDSFRVGACADSMKLLMVSLQHLCSQEGADEAQLSAFLSLIFDVFTSLISYNGLPNHPTGKPKADPSIGRMSAQGIVYVVRASPAAFKNTMALLTTEDRTTLEMAVRADMSGYAAAQSQAPVKKKLSLKGFK